MTTNNPETTQLYPLTRRDMMRTAAFVAGAATVGGAATTMFPTVRADSHFIETCDKPLDIVLTLDYSGSIGSALWSDIEDGARSFVDVLADDHQLGVVTFGDTAKAYDFGTQDYLLPAQNGATDNRPTLKSILPTVAPPNENGTHMAAALDFADDILDAQGRDGVEVIILLTDGEPNYQNGLVGDGTTPPEDEADGTVGNVSGFVPTNTVSFDPEGDGANTYEYDGGSSGTDAIITDGERDETAEVATAAKDDGTRIVAVGIGNGVDDAFLANRVASAPEDYVQVDDASTLGDVLAGVLSEICEPECVDCELDGMVKYEYTVEYDDEGNVTFDGFVLDGEYDGGITYVSDKDKDGSMYDPMSATFNLGNLCSAWAVVKAGQEFNVVDVEADDNGDVTVDYIAPYAISFVAFFCTEEAAQAYAENFPSRGRGGGRPQSFR